MLASLGAPYRNNWLYLSPMTDSRVVCVSMETQG